MFIPITAVINANDLEEKVRDFFRELGYTAEIQQTVPLANQGVAVVDVLATKDSASLVHKIIFECKYWNSEVPRAIVQSFKMDVLEAGANFGIIVSKQGFQSGAYKGVGLTTVKLYTFEELQKAFSKEWEANNFWPLIEQHNSLVDMARIYEIGSTKYEVHQLALFNQILVDLNDDLREAITFPLAVWNDYFSRDAMRYLPGPVYKRSGKDRHDGKPREASFHDARTMAACFKELFNQAFERWKNFHKTFEEEFFKASENQRRTFMGLSPL